MGGANSIAVVTMVCLLRRYAVVEIPAFGPTVSGCLDAGQWCGICSAMPTVCLQIAFIKSTGTALLHCVLKQDSLNSESIVIVVERLKLLPTKGDSPTSQDCGVSVPAADCTYSD